MLSEMSQTEKDKYSMIFVECQMESKKYNKCEYNKIQTSEYNKKTSEYNKTKIKADSQI